MRAVALVLLLVQAADPVPPAARPGQRAGGHAGYAQGPDELFVEGNAAFRTGRFDAAIERYRALLAAGVDDGEVYYNLGNAYLRRGEIAEAIAAYRAAQARLPRDQDVEANLRFARERTQDALAPPEPPAALRALFFWHYALSRRELVTATAVINALFWTTLGLALFRRRAAFRGASVALGLAALALGASAAVRLARPNTVAVIQGGDVPVYSGVGESSVVRFRLHEGAEATASDRDGGWVKITLADGKQGWVPQRDVLLVRL
jgi:tetratricopeptide (TPR) repeat protein